MARRSGRAHAAAAEILLTGRHITAQEAKELGLVNHVVSADAKEGPKAFAEKRPRTFSVAEREPDDIVRVRKMSC